MSDVMEQKYHCGHTAGYTVFTCEETKRQPSGNQAFRKLHPRVLKNLQTLLYTAWTNKHTHSVRRKTDGH